MAAGALAGLVIVAGFGVFYRRPAPEPPSPPVEARAEASLPAPAARPLEAAAPAVARSARPPAPAEPDGVPRLQVFEGRGTTPAGDPASVERALAGASVAELQLGAQLGRADLEVPPEMTELFRLRAAGAPPAELQRFVRERFPRNARLRALTLDWLDRHPRR